MKPILVFVVLLALSMHLKAQTKTVTKEVNIVVTQEDPGAPEFPGGEKKQEQYIAKHLKYPAAARRAHIQGKVLVEFDLENDGRLSNIKVQKGLTKEMNDEAVRVMKASPKWVIPYDKNQTGKWHCVVPVIFTLHKS